MHVVRTFRMSAFVAVAALTVGALGTTAAQAKPNKPGGVAGLHATADATSLTSATTSYAVTSGWTATANATSYKVSLTKSGTTLASGTVTTNQWKPTVTGTPGTASLSVRAVIGHRQGKPSSVSLKLADVNAPQGAFSTTWVNSTGVATLKQDSLSDDSGTGGIIRSVDWGDSGPTSSWTSGTTLTHTYAHSQAGRFVPTVTLTDAAGNHVTVEVPAVVIQDDQAPTAGTYTVSDLSPWTTLTSVTVAETAAPSDNWSPADKIVRTVDWGDGNTSTWAGQGSAHHVYAAVGSYTLTVTDTDEAHHDTPALSATVVAKADTVAPKVTITKRKPAHSVRAWKTLRGQATDTAGTGVKSVSVKAVEKRGRSWFGYNSKTHRWVKTATKAKAFSRAVAFTRTTNASHVWTAKLRGLAKGTLVAKASATDLVGNHSTTVSRSASLTTR